MPTKNKYASLYDEWVELELRMVFVGLGEEDRQETPREYVARLKDSLPSDGGDITR